MIIKGQSILETKKNFKSQIYLFFLYDRQPKATEKKTENGSLQFAETTGETQICSCQFDFQVFCVTVKFLAGFIKKQPYDEPCILQTNGE